uniref:Death domain-associated protein 6 n=1 Tax=Tetraodon nigroviridis TaxID=99883 RepID=H3CIB9_TETNG
VAPASLADKIIVLDGDDDGEEESLSASCSVSTSIQPQAEVFQPKVQQPVASPITQSPCVSARREPHVLQAENERLFGEFVDHCLADTTDCPEVLDYLKTRHAKASPEYLCSVEFRNTLGHCLSRAQAHRSKTFVYINELCTVLTQHAAKKRQVTTQVEPDSSSAASVAFRPTSPLLESGDATLKTEGDGLPENREDVTAKDEADKKKKRASRRQIAYLENLLKMYNDEIHRLQKSELSLEDLDAEDSLFIQESKLKRKLMKIYEKLCELKGCSTLTGRVIEHRITYSSTRYPEINRRIERFINGPEAQQTPPDYQDILQQMLRANERHNLCLSRKQLNQMAKEAFREVGTRIQDRRHLDLVYNFGSHLTDPYKPATDPALLDASLLRKLRSNREVAVSRLEEVISKYANKQEDTEELERRKRQEKKRRSASALRSSGRSTGTASPHTFPFQDSKSEKEGKKEANEEESSDPDIEEEMQASAQQEGPDQDDEDDDDDGAHPVCNGTNRDSRSGEGVGTASAGKRRSLGTSGVTLSPAKASPRGLGCPTSPRQDAVSFQPESPQTEPQEPGQESDREAVASEEPLESHTPGPGVATVTKDGPPPPVSPGLSLDKGCGETCNGHLAASQPQETQEEEGDGRGRRPPGLGTPGPGEIRAGVPGWGQGAGPLPHAVPSCGSEVELPAAMDGTCSSPPQQLESSQDHPLTPPPKKNKVNVATQCDPEEVIVLSDSE